mmetsp:Transcript_37504/g.94271  ORF Transcript_37504/g.94271 Transcript_37504/m.94271 type:complete len:250 (-) Transcript_37504:127-876(-)
MECAGVGGACGRRRVHRALQPAHLLAQGGNLRVRLVDAGKVQLRLQACHIAAQLVEAGGLLAARRQVGQGALEHAHALFQRGYFGGVRLDVLLQRVHVGRHGAKVLDHHAVLVEARHPPRRQGRHHAAQVLHAHHHVGLRGRGGQCKHAAGRNRASARQARPALLQHLFQHLPQHALLVVCALPKRVQARGGHFVVHRGLEGGDAVLHVAQLLAQDKSRPKVVRVALALHAVQVQCRHGCRWQASRQAG